VGREVELHGGLETWGAKIVTGWDPVKRAMEGNGGKGRKEKLASVNNRHTTLLSLLRSLRYAREMLCWC